MGLKVGEVKLEKYNSEWVNKFDEEKENLQKLFGNLALTIEHVGSTSVPKLSAKPIIDIAVGVKSLKDFEIVKPLFLEFPYSVKEDSADGEILVRKGSEDNRTHFIHVMEIDSERYKETIIFRDYLRTREDALKDYENLKKDLAIKYKDNRKLYTASKNEFIREIIERAKNEME